MKVISGRLTVLLPGSKDWKEFKKDSSFTVEANLKFQLKVEEETAYICYYQ